MRKIFLYLLFLFLFPESVFSAEKSSLQQVDIRKIDLTEERTEFRSAGASVDHFLNALQAKILYHFEKSVEHFSLIFSSAKDEAVKKAEETITRAGEETAGIIKEQTRKVVGETIEKELKKHSPVPAAQEKKKPENKIAAPPAKKEAEKKNSRIPKKKSSAATEEKLILPDLPEPPEAF